MFWALPAAMAVMGGLQANQAQKQQKAQNMAAAAQTEYSPWTGMGAGQIQTGAPSTLAGAAQGGLGGYMMGKNIESAGIANDKNALELEALKRRKEEEMQNMSLAGTNPVA